MTSVIFNRRLSQVERLPYPKHCPVCGSSRVKVSEKGAVSLYGVGRFPVTLYKEQWAKVLGMKDEIEKTDRKIDEAVYKLYGLTEEEIKIVGGK